MMNEAATTLTDRRITDEELIRNFQQGDERAYNEIVNRFSGPLLNFIYRIIGDSAFAEDLLQETFIRVYQNKNSYREIAKFSTWIYTIASNLSKTELRRQKVRRWFSLSGSKNDDRPMEIANKDYTPDETMLQNSTLSLIHQEIQKLPISFKEVIILRDVQELSYEEISTILNIPLGTVKSRVNRGRARLQKTLKPMLRS